ncbi:MAG: cupin domain-containing protein [Minwuia sp.]|uniref:cupin domain-containing protein n=1 Tax=Minwuia sp. TaxID=2493630 RepID=UPI003A86B601
MDRATFEAELARDGFEAAGVKTLEPHCHNDAHAHDFEVRAMVIEGEITLTYDGKTETCRPGDVLTMAKGCEHTEDVGADGLKFVVGRKY